MTRTRLSPPPLIILTPVQNCILQHCSTAGAQCYPMTFNVITSSSLSPPVHFKVVWCTSTIPSRVLTVELTSQFYCCVVLYTDQLIGLHQMILIWWTVNSQFSLYLFPLSKVLAWELIFSLSMLKSLYNCQGLPSKMFEMQHQDAELQPL